MKKSFFLLFFFCCLANVSSAKIKVDSLTYGRFGKIIIYHPAKTPTSVALFISGDGGWEHGVINMAKDIALQGALVLGIDAKHYRSSLEKSFSNCYYPASDFENLSLYIQKKLKFPVYFKPVLIGYSYGATLTYGILLQAPSNTFKGGIGLGFSPDIESKKPLCKGEGLTQQVIKAGVSFYLEKARELSAPFIVLNGEKDKSCPFKVSAEFLKGIKNVELVALPKVGHGFSIADKWLPQFNSSYGKILDAPNFTERKNSRTIFFNARRSIPNLMDIPLVTIPPNHPSQLPFIVMISGDGGWTSFDQSFSENLAKKGFYIIGLDAQKYFWNAKTPERTTLDVLKVILQHEYQFHTREFILVGYSFGASVLPFIASKFPSSIKGQIKGLFAFSPDLTADFEIHLADMLSLATSQDEYDVLTEFRKIKAIPVICCFGSEEDKKVVKKFRQDHLKVLILPGSHHFNNDFEELSNVITRNIK